jgi:hypothetical protein
MSLLVLYNPACGNRTAKQFVYDHVLPALEAVSATPNAVLASEYPGHAGELVLGFMKDNDTHTADVAIASGDGTVHEIVNALYENPSEDGKPWAVSFILIPVGTANALFSSLFASCPSRDIESPLYKLQSVHAYLGDAVARPLTITTTTILPLDASRNSSASTTPRVTVRSIVVTSTALHASILHDSERLRSSHPGIERFKIAAQENITRWYHASVRLLPLTGPKESGVLHFKTDVHQLLPASGYEADPDIAGSVLLPAQSFSYFLATGTVDRLEPEFRITPLMMSNPPAGPAVDVVLVRPLNDPSLSKESEAARSAFASKAGKILGGAYAEGTHVRFLYTQEGDIVQPDPQNPSASAFSPVEYFRCGGWEWIPVGFSPLWTSITGNWQKRLTSITQSPNDPSARFLCADGTIFELEPNEMARSVVDLPGSDKTTPVIAVYGR